MYRTLYIWLKLDYSIYSFIYDGLSHKPEYTWDADCEVSLTFYGSQNPTEIGTYYYDLNVEDPNYVGSYSGQLNITQPEIVITVNDITITYGESIPALPTDKLLSGNFQLP